MVQSLSLTSSIKDRDYRELWYVDRLLNAQDFTFNLFCKCASDH
jgi:hypothetical protein